VTSTATLPTIALASLIAGCSPGSPSGASDAPGPARAAQPSTRYEDAVAAATQAVGAAQGRPEALALALLNRAQLTGSYDDYAASDRALQQLAGATGACLTVARIHLALHRFQRAADAAAACQGRFGQTPAEHAELLGIGADAAFFAGQYPGALRDYRAALRLDQSLANLARLSRYHAHTGAPVEAAALLDRAEHLYHGDSAQPLAWLAIQRGLLALDAGRWDDALAHYLRAERLMPGWWLAEEHAAEVYALRGEFDVALPQYEALAQRTGQPEFMDAIARILLEQHQRERAAGWIGRARALYRQRASALPEAAAAHALAHFLQFEPLAGGELLALAQKDAAARPGAEGRIHLAQAYLRLGRSADAAAALRPVLASAWDTAQLHAVAAQVFAATRDIAAAQRAQARALAMNPRAQRMYAAAPPAGNS
jgi:hypothetical protein